MVRLLGTSRKHNLYSQKGGGKQKANASKVLRLSSVFKASEKNTRSHDVGEEFSPLLFSDHRTSPLGFRDGRQFYTKKTCKKFLMLLKGVTLFLLVAVATGNRLPYLAGECEVEAGSRWSKHLQLFPHLSRQTFGDSYPHDEQLWMA